MRKLKNSVIAITGAGSGIGQALAIQCARKGAKLALSDVNLQSLEATRVLCQETRAENILIEQVDVRDRDQVDNWAKAAENHFGEVNVVINNAGVAMNVAFEQMKYDDLKWMMDINYWGVVHGCMSFLPLLKKAEWGHIVNVSSLFGLISIPNQTAYNSAKFAVRGLTEGLRMELEMAGYNIGVSCVHPGGIKTNIANSARMGPSVGKQLSADEFKDKFNKLLAKTTPEQAAKTIIDAIENNHKRVLVGLDARICDLMQRSAPTFYQKVIKQALSF
ncbi:MAG: acetoin dehydrogenase [Proteobacteria bacterium]|nr:MAG: acetoin dehydrogenase [Pseudomonadota bacterium]PIE40039.1 MAG: acetoin dehydrogenase [Gammaproteobacteria bacterium]